MDDPAVLEAALTKALGTIGRINRRLGAYPPSLAGLAALAPDSDPIRVLDVGTGGGDVARRMLEWGHRTGRRVEVTGIDLTRAAVDEARRVAGDLAGAEFLRADLFDLDPSKRFDVVHACQVLHHFSDADAVRALARMYALARRGVVINDLHRHPLAWAGIRLWTRLFTDDAMVRYDGPLSVLRGFTRAELVRLCRAAELPEPELVWHRWFRWRMMIRRPSLEGVSLGRE
jgi:2-polyprenyl-3-methyl-5-hydroxy-6-metoxy-1,4-benzoquinol methylase